MAEPGEKKEEEQDVALVVADQRLLRLAAVLPRDLLDHRLIHAGPFPPLTLLGSPRIDRQERQGYQQKSYEHGKRQQPNPAPGKGALSKPPFVFPSPRPG